MSGVRLFSFRQGDRSEYLAHFLLSSLGLVTPVARQEDIGFDFHCALADQESGTLSFGFPFLVQIKSAGDPNIELLPKRGRRKRKPKKGQLTSAPIPSHLSWLLRQEVPLYLGIIDRERLSLRLYSLAPMWFIFFGDEHCANCGGIRFIPQLDELQPGGVGRPTRAERLSIRPELYAYDIPLGHPIVYLTAQDALDEKRLAEEKSRLRYCLAHEQQNLIFYHADLRHFVWFAETDRKNPHAMAAYYYDEAAPEAARMNNVYSFLGRALIPLALLYKKDGRAEALAGLKSLFAQMPWHLIPGPVQRALPTVFDPVIPTIATLAPNECSQKQIDQFVALVKTGGEVEEAGLEVRVRNAAHLFFLHYKGILQGVGALKRPDAHYRLEIGKKAKFPVSAEAYPFELGWVYVRREARNFGFSTALTNAAVNAGNGAALFATTRTDNGHMQGALAKVGFKAAGEPYPSKSAGKQIQLFVR